MSTEDERRDALWGGVQWTFAAQLQLGRLREAQAVLTANAHLRPTHLDDTYRQPFLRLDAERHFLIVAMANVGRALKLLDACGLEPQAIDDNERTRIRLLRNIFEHWDDGTDDPRSQRALAEFRAKFPNDDPHEHRWSADGTADTIGGLPIGLVADTVEGLRQWLLALEAGNWVWTGHTQS